MFDLARLIRRPSKGWFSSTEWHDEAVRLMAEEAGVTKSQVIRAAIEMLSVNFDLGVFCSAAPKTSVEQLHVKQADVSREDGGRMSDLLFSSFPATPTGSGTRVSLPEMGDLRQGGEEMVLVFVED